MLCYVMFVDVCNNDLLKGRNISTTVTSIFNSGDPRYIYDPLKALLNSTDETDSQGHIKSGAWTAGVNDQNQFWQVRQVVTWYVKSSCLLAERIMPLV